MIQTMRDTTTGSKGIALFVFLFLCGFLLVSGLATAGELSQAAPEQKPASASAAPSSPGAAPSRARSFSTPGLTASARRYYQAIWGVDILGVKPVSSGAMLRFSYRVLNAKKAKVLNDKKVTPVLIDQKTRARLAIPQMDKVGLLRQSPTPENGREYYMLFSNRGSLVHPGSRVDVVIGTFRAEGLVVGSE